MTKKKQQKNEITIRTNKVATVKTGTPTGLLQDLRSLIDQARIRVALQVNTELVTLYWHIGNRIQTEILRDERAEYGEAVIDSLAKHLTQEYGKGFSRPALFRMVKFAEVFPDYKIVSTVLRQLSWSHFIQLLYLKDELRRNFYAEMCAIEGWSVRTLQDKIKRMLFERTAIAKKPEEVAEQELRLLRERGNGILSPLARQIRALRWRRIAYRINFVCWQTPHKGDRTAGN